MAHARLTKAAAVALVCLALLAPLGGGVSAAPMAAGGDTRDVAHLPLIDFKGPVTVKPGESGTVAFDLTNRYNATMQGVLAEVAFSVGGDWLEARPVAEVKDAPVFVAVSRLPTDLAPGAVFHFSAPFSTNASTPSGVYLVSLVVRFAYAGPNGTAPQGVFASPGSVPAARRGDVNMSDYNGTLERLGIDGLAPDSSIQVQAGTASSLWWAAVGFGVAVMVVGGAYGWSKSRSQGPRGRAK